MSSITKEIPLTSENLIGDWIGDTRGTHISRVFIEFSVVQENLVCDVRVQLGDQIGRLTGVQNHENNRVIYLQQFDPQITESELQRGVLTITELTKNEFKCKWEFGNGAKGIGIFLRGAHYLNRHETAAQDTSSSTTEKSLLTPPRHVIKEDVKLGRVFLVKPEFISIIEKVKSYLPDDDCFSVIGYSDKGRTVRKFEEDWKTDTNLPPSVDNISIERYEQGTGIQRFIGVYFNQTSDNHIVVQSSDETWSIGVKEGLHSYCSNYVSVGTNTLLKYSLILYLTLSSIVVYWYAPEFDYWERFIFVVSVFFANMVFAFSYQKIPNTKVLLNEESRNSLYRNLPSILIGLLMIAVSVGVNVVIESLDMSGLTDLFSRK